MPCPPSWEELEMMRIDAELSRAHTNLAERLPQLARALALVEELRPAPIEEFETCVAFARELRDRGVPPYSGKRAGGDWPSQEDLDAEWAHALFHTELAKRLELCLCVLGTAIARHVRDTRCALTPALEIELARHREHRERERADRVAWLEGAGALAEAARIRAIDPETLCTDRLAFYRT